MELPGIARPHSPVRNMHDVLEAAPTGASCGSLGFPAGPPGTPQVGGAVRKKLRVYIFNEHFQQQQHQQQQKGGGSSGSGGEAAGGAAGAGGSTPAGGHGAWSSPCLGGVLCVVALCMDPRGLRPGMLLKFRRGVGSVAVGNLMLWAGAACVTKGGLPSPGSACACPHLE